jgi:hypothetical protein
MNKSKLIQLLKTFTKQEIKDFEKFISSPYFSPGRNLKPLFNVLKKYYPEFNSPNFTVEKIFSIIYPGKKYDKKKSGHALQVMVSEMTSLAEKFLGFEVLKKDNEGYGVYQSISKALLNRNFFVYSHKLNLKNIERIKKADSLLDFFHEMGQLNLNLQETTFSIKTQLESNKYFERMPLYFFGYMLWWLSKLINDYQAKAFTHNFNPKIIKLLEMCVKSFDPEIFKNECYDDGLGTKELVLAHYYLIKSQLGNEEEDLRAAIEIYKRHFHNFTRPVKWGFLIMILNICVLKRPVERIKYSSLGSNLIDFVIERGFYNYYEGQPMTRDTYYQFFSFKLDVQEYRSLKAFIDTSLEKISPEYRELVFQFSYAWLSFRNNDYERALEYLSKFSTQHIDIKNFSNMLRIASLFSLGHIEEALSGLNSFEHFARNNAVVSRVISNANSLFTKSVHALFKYRTDWATVDDNMLDKIIKDNRNSKFHFWFEAEAEKLRK